ncbi:MAG: F0F1 ATP synthase subunit A [Rhodospirillaceae bacterium]|nr:F0F1 ATP synthase subunit A [Rhodospirillaceae bacterium]
MAEHAEGGHGPMHQFEIQQLIPIKVGGYDISYTNSALFMTFAVVLTALLFWGATRHRTMVPGRLQATAEMLYEFVAGMVKENTGQEGMKYFPFVFTLFLFILFGNFLGLMPYAFTYTSHIIVTAAMALFIFVAVTIIGFARHGLHFFSLFVPPGAPLGIAIILAPLEFFSYLIRPVSLSLRLFANMLAGHVLLKVLAGFIISLGVVFGAVPFIAVFGVTFLEIMVAAIQAYVFALLTCIYLNDAIHLH